MDKSHFLDGFATDLETNAKQLYAEFREVAIDYGMKLFLGTVEKRELRSYQMGKVRKVFQHSTVALTTILRRLPPTWK